MHTVTGECDMRRPLRYSLCSKDPEVGTFVTVQVFVDRPKANDELAELMTNLIAKGLESFKVEVEAFLEFVFGYKKCSVVDRHCEEVRVQSVQCCGRRTWRHKARLMERDVSKSKLVIQTVF